MKPEELAKTARLPIEQEIWNLINSKPDEIFTSAEIAKLLKLGRTSVQHSVASFPECQKHMARIDGRIVNVVGSEKAINKFKSLL